MADNPTSAYYTGDGVTTDRVVPCPYLSPSHIKVTVDGVATAFSYVSSTIIRISPAPAVGKTIRVYRETPKTPIVDWADGAIILGRNMNAANLQNIYIAEEAYSYAEGIAEQAKQFALDNVDAAIADALGGIQESLATLVTVPRNEAIAARDVAEAHASNANSQRAVAEAARNSAEQAAVTAGNVATGAQAAYSALQKLYLGSKTSDPTTDNAGLALNAGALYFNTAIGKMKIWDGASWQLAYNQIDLGEVSFAAGDIRNDSGRTGETVKDALNGLTNVNNTADINKVVKALTVDSAGYNVSPAPTTYPDKTASFQFVEKARIGNPPSAASENYAHLLNLNGWISSGWAAGGYPTQVSFGDRISFRRATSASEWGGWKGVLDTSHLSTDSTLASNSDSFVPSQKAVKAYAVNKGGDTMTGRLVIASGGGKDIAEASMAYGELEVRGKADGTGGAMIEFHRPTAFAAYFGLGSDSAWRVGGASYGATSYKIWHEGILPVASAAAIRSGASADNIVSAKSSFDALAEVALTYSTTITPDLSTGFNFNVTLTGNATLANPSSGLTPGRSGHVRIVQDGVGARTLSYGSYWKFEGGTPPLLSTAAAATDYIDYEVISATNIRARLSKAWA